MTVYLVRFGLLSAVPFAGFVCILLITKHKTNQNPTTNLYNKIAERSEIGQQSQPSPNWPKIGSQLILRFVRNNADTAQTKHSRYNLGSSVEITYA